MANLAGLPVTMLSNDPNDRNSITYPGVTKTNTKNAANSEA